MDRRSFVVALAVAGVAVCAASPLLAGKVLLKNGTEIEGEIVDIKGFSEQMLRQRNGELETTPYLLVDGGYRRYIVSDRQREIVDRGRDLVPFDFFELPQKKSASDLQLGSVGLPKRVTEFDPHGHRTVYFNGPNGKELPIVQGVTRIAPEYVTVEGITHNWWQGIATLAVPPDQLAAMIGSAIDRADPEDRMSVVRFYTEAGLYEPAAAELEGIRKDFPFLAAKVEELDGLLRQMRARFVLAELRARQAAGQHRLALAVAESFPTDLGFDAEVLRQVEELRSRYSADRERADLAVLLLGELEAKLDDSSQRAAVAALRPVLRGELDRDGLSRLDAFLTLAEDETLPPSERLAVAYSGWVVGSAKATTDLTKALGLWRARHLAGEYLRTADAGRKAELLEELNRIESVGTEAIADLVPLLPPWLETPDLMPGRVETLETTESVRGWGGSPRAASPETVQVAGPVRYAVVLPPEYTPTQSYPMLVALRPSEWTIERTAEFWGIGRDGAGREAPGPAARVGYVIVVPEYAEPKQPDYGYTAREHEAVLAVLCDARKRFVIDGDRVFLAGHGMGADATFDVAMAHPDLFAGAAAVSGLCRHFTKYYWQNAKRVPFYVVNGELDRNARSVNASDLGRMMKSGQDVTYCEYVGRGYEYYQEELADVFAWMGRLRRAEDPKEVEAAVLRASDDRFYWVKAEGIPRSALTGNVVNASGTSIKAMTLEARITTGNSITLRSGAARHVLRLNDGLVDLEHRVKVREGGRLVFNDFVEPSTEALLDDLSESGDRQRLYPVRLVLE